MIPAQKILRVFRLISLLRSPIGHSIPDIEKILGVSNKTVYRYLELLEELGMYPDQKMGTNRWFIADEKENSLDYTFSTEESKVMMDLLQFEGGDNPMKEEIKRKLFVHSELPLMVDKIHTSMRTRIIKKLSIAIREGKQVILEKYQSAHGETVRDRKVEPFGFLNKYKTVEAFDLEDKKVKHFGTERIADVEIRGGYQHHEEHHHSKPVDCFGYWMEEPQEAVLELSQKAWIFLKEEFPEAVEYVIKDENSGNYIFKGPVGDFQGVGRFVMGLINEIDIKKPVSLQEYVDAQLENYQK